MKIELHQMTYENFKPYGCLLSYPGDEEPDIAVDDLDYWKRPMDLSNFKSDGELSFMRIKQRGIVLDTLDMLPESAEIYISLDGRRSVFFAAPSKEGNSEEPNMEKLRAFIFSGPGGFMVNPGIWHWTPFPLSHNTDYLLGLRNNVLLKNDRVIEVGEGQILYFKLDEKVEVKL
jgi:ureidoglycolate lyase